MTAALILAAGQNLEDEIPGPMNAVGKVSSIRRVILVYRQAGIKRIVVVTGYDAETLEKHCSHLGATFVRNEDYKNGDMLASAKVGLTYLRGKCDKAFISPADIPLFSAETVNKMENTKGSVIVPMHKDEAGHPLLLAEELFNRVLRYEGGGGLQGALSANDIEKVFFSVPDVGIITHVQDNTDISAVIEKHSLKKIRAENKIMLIGEKGFFGPGTMHLLNLTKETGSLRKAAQQMGVSYSKAWKMIADVEDQLGILVLESKAGGQKGGGSQLTEQGNELIKRYEELVNESAEFVQNAYERIFETPGLKP